ncbi:IRK-interacting protein [Quillaja saponaria]|uniref:IRK-interacting protein n=1 Tax=Quillaja saponaria TaxID=32244 RepID=A0AAD7L4U3_QUISA|nr:IRK-interacting protein [Quillaja saponaria]
MPEMDGSSKPPQISEMFQKFALAFKTKTYEFFAEEEETAAAEDSDGFSLLDSAEEIITDQKVVVIKPDGARDFSQQKPPPPPPEFPSTKPFAETQFTKPEQRQEFSHPAPQVKLTRSISQPQMRDINTQLTQTLISSIFATISSFEASYFQLQTAHVPFVEENVKAADRALVSHLQRLSEFKKFYVDCCRNPNFNNIFPTGSCLEAQVEENQSKLRTLGTISNRLQSEIEQKDNEVSALRGKLGEIQKSNVKMSKKLSGNSNKSSEVLLTVRVFDSVFQDACKATHNFTKVLINFMRKVGWDLDMVANTVQPDIEYAKKRHNQYAFLSYVCLGMFRGFDSEEFGLDGIGTLCNGHVSNTEKKSTVLKQLLEHVSCNPMELLSRHPSSDFSKFCEKKYQQLIHPTMESSIFSNFDQNEVILNSWRSLSVFYESFVRMASSIWTLHKLAFSFDPVVEIFQVERGVDFSIVYMEDITRKCLLPCKSRMKVGFTVVPGFKIGRTVIQSQVYLIGLKCTE